MPDTHNVIIAAPSCVLALHARHCALLEAEAPDVEIDAVLHRYVAELIRLATTPATTTADLHEKARALATCVGGRREEPPTVNGDHGLAASLIADVLALA